MAPASLHCCLFMPAAQIQHCTATRKRLKPTRQRPLSRFPEEGEMEIGKSWPAALSAAALSRLTATAILRSCSPVQLSQAKPCTVVPAVKNSSLQKYFGVNCRILFLVCVQSTFATFFYKSWVVQLEIRLLQSSLHKKEKKKTTTVKVKL